MSNPWKPLQPDEIAVAHVSDLHFGSDKKGSEKATEVWDLVHNFLTNTLKPKLLLVTGDLVHNPDPQQFKKAKAALDAVGFRYFVCRGNHDCNRLGNRVTRYLLVRLSWLRRGLRILRWTTLSLVFLAVLSFYWSWILGLATVSPAAALAALLWFGPRILFKWFDVGYVFTLFDHEFKDHVLTDGRALPYSLGDWSLGLLGLDSSYDVDYFARGRVSAKQLLGLAGATSELAVDNNSRKEFDLCILLVHHHLLSIRLLEPTGEGHEPSGLFNVSCLVNAGTVLERLAESRVDLVLHGHEHKHNWATYGSLEKGSGPVRVVAAGSATGNDSYKGCQQAAATLNVLIFKPDRSVRLRRVAFRDGAWRQEDDLQLFAAEDVRQARLRRRAMRDEQNNLSLQSEITSEIIKTFIFTRERNVEVYWVMTEWQLQGAEFREPVLNSTGEPCKPEVFLVGACGERHLKEKGRDNIRFERAGADHKWYLCFPIPEAFRSQSIRVTIRFTWEHAALLTHEELQMMRTVKPSLGIPRNQDLEFATVRTHGQPAAALEVHVSLPPEYAPQDEENEVHVYVHEDFHDWNDWTSNRHKAEAAPLQRQLRVLGKGRYSLRIPFPRSDRRYTIAWKPVAEQLASQQLSSEKFNATPFFQKLIPSHRRALLESFAAVFQKTPLWGNATVALFVKVAGSSSLKFLDCVALAAPAVPPFVPPPDNLGQFAERMKLLAAPAAPAFVPPPFLDSVNMSNDRHPLVQAWWGCMVSLARPAPQAQELADATARAVEAEKKEAEARDLGFFPGEARLLCIPIRLNLTATANPPPWAIIRLGVGKNALDLLGPGDDSIITVCLHEAVARLLSDTLHT